MYLPHMVAPYHWSHRLTPTRRGQRPWTRFCKCWGKMSRWRAWKAGGMRWGIMMRGKGSGDNTTQHKTSFIPMCSLLRSILSCQDSVTHHWWAWRDQPQVGPSSILQWKETNEMQSKHSFEYSRTIANNISEITAYANTWSFPLTNDQVYLEWSAMGFTSTGTAGMTVVGSSCGWAGGHLQSRHTQADWTTW